MPVPPSPPQTVPSEGLLAPPLQCKHRCQSKATCTHACCNRSSAAISAWLATQPVRHSEQPFSSNPVFGASDAFFGTQEMLETALRGLNGPRELLPAMGVSPRWRETILGNTFKKAMFLAPDDTERVLPAETMLWGRRWQPSQMPTNRLLNNALLELRPPGNPAFDDYPYPRVHLLRDPLTDTDTSSIRRQMFLTQPPSESLHIGLAVYFEEPRGYLSGHDLRGTRRRWMPRPPMHIHFPGGTTYNDLLEAINAEVSTWNKGYKLDWRACHFAFP